MPSVNGKNLVSARIHERTRGNWTGTIEVDTDEALAESAVIDIDGVTWTGTVYRGDLDDGRYRATVVGGAGGLHVAVPALWYDSGVELRTPLADILGIGGETLSANAQAAVTGKIVPSWHRAKATVSELLGGIRDKGPAGTVWRMMRDGTVWFGVDDFPDLAKAADTIIIDPDPTDGSREIAPETPHVYPGVTYEGTVVTEVITTLSEGGQLRQQLVNRMPGSEVPTPEEQTDARIERKLTYLRLYPAKVLSQSGGTVDVLPDDERVRGRGLTGVPIRHGIPGLTVTLSLGSKILLGFDGGDPSAPFAALWPDGSSVSDATFGGDLNVTGEVKAMSAGGSFVTLTKLLIPSPFGPLGPPIPGN